jgi:hypothetical protein
MHEVIWTDHPPTPGSIAQERVEVVGDAYHTRNNENMTIDCSANDLFGMKFANFHPVAVHRATVLRAGQTSQAQVNEKENQWLSITVAVF